MAAAQPNMNACQVVASESGRPFANAADILYDTHKKPYILLDKLIVDHRKSLRLPCPALPCPSCAASCCCLAGTEEHPSNPHHTKLFLDTGENIGVIANEEPERLLPKFAGGTPAVATHAAQKKAGKKRKRDAATNFRILGKNSMKARLLHVDGRYYKWAGGAWAPDPMP